MSPRARPPLAPAADRRDPVGLHPWHGVAARVRSPLDDLLRPGLGDGAGLGADPARPSGVAGFIIRDGTRVHALYVAPDRRGQGIGRALLAEAKTRAEMLDLWVLAGNLPARAFYLAQGSARSRKAGRGQ